MSLPSLRIGQRLITLEGRFESPNNPNTHGELVMPIGHMPITALILAFLLQVSTQQPVPPLPPTVDGGAALTVVYASEQFFEGPSWDPVGKKLYFTAFAKDNEQVLRLDGPNNAVV